MSIRKFVALVGTSLAFALPTSSVIAQDAGSTMLEECIQACRADGQTLCAQKCIYLIEQGGGSSGGSGRDLWYTNYPTTPIDGCNTAQTRFCTDNP